MRYLTIILLLTSLGFCKQAKCDTIDYYIVYYNGKQMAGNNLHGFGKRVYTINISDVGEKDTLTIRYFTDTRSPNAICVLTTVDSVGVSRAVFSSKGIGSAMSFSLYEFVKSVDDRRRTRQGIYDVYYCDLRYDKKDIGSLLFKIKLE